MNHIEEYHDPELKQMKLEKKKKKNTSDQMSLWGHFQQGS